MMTRGVAFSLILFFLHLLSCLSRWLHCAFFCAKMLKVREVNLISYLHPSNKSLLLFVQGMSFFILLFTTLLEIENSIPILLQKPRIIPHPRLKLLPPLFKRFERHYFYPLPISPIHYITAKTREEIKCIFYYALRED